MCGNHVMFCTGIENCHDRLSRPSLKFPYEFHLRMSYLFFKRKKFHVIILSSIRNRNPWFLHPFYIINKLINYLGSNDTLNNLLRFPFTLQTKFKRTRISGTPLGWTWSRPYSRQWKEHPKFEWKERERVWELRRRSDCPVLDEQSVETELMTWNSKYVTSTLIL